MFEGIDLFSDTLTKPSVAMRKAMVEAVVGDEQKGEDPTTLELESMVAEITGHSAAFFLPSATMANEIAIRAQTNPGDVLIASENCHLFIAEAGGPAIHSQVLAKPLKTVNGVFSGEDVEKAFRPEKGPHYSVTRLVSVENTANLDGGTVWPMDTLDSVLEVCEKLGLKTHLDGARLFNAAIKLSLPPSKISSGFDTVTLCLSKGLGCPLGAVLAFEKPHFEKIRKLKQLMGGAMRQSGILAAAGIYALRNNVSRLEQDHVNASSLASGLGNLAHIKLENPIPSSNMVFFRWEHPSVPGQVFCEQCRKNGVRFSTVGPNRFRAVTHLDVSHENIKEALRRIHNTIISL